MSTKQSKAAFVRSFPFDSTAAEVIAAGKKKGIKLTTAYVYVIRSKDRGRKAAKKAKVANGRAEHYLDNVAAPSTGLPTLEGTFASPLDDDKVFADIVKRKGTEWAREQIWS